MFCVLKLLQWLVDFFDKVAKTCGWRREADFSRTVPECCGGWKRARLNGTLNSQNRGHLSTLDRMVCFARPLCYKRLTYDVSGRHGDKLPRPDRSSAVEACLGIRPRFVDQIDTCRNGSHNTNWCYGSIVSAHDMLDPKFTRPMQDNLYLEMSTFHMHM